VVVEERLQNGWGAELRTIAQLGTVLCLQGFFEIAVVGGQYFPVGFGGLSIHCKFELSGFELRDRGR
jgi:hypothetical protein